MTAPFTIGERIWFPDERNPYTVQATSEDGRWVVATKPFAARRTVLYTVLDTVNRVRGRDDYHGLGYETRQACLDAVGMFETGQAEHSRRHPPIPYVIERRKAGTDSTWTETVLRPGGNAYVAQRQPSVVSYDNDPDPGYGLIVLRTHDIDVATALAMRGWAVNFDSRDPLPAPRVGWTRLVPWDTWTGHSEKWSWDDCGPSDGGAVPCVTFGADR